MPNGNIYEININNLDNGEILKKGTVLNSESIILKRGFPYSWWVFSKSEKLFLSSVTGEANLENLRPEFACNQKIFAVWYSGYTVQNGTLLQAFPV